MHAPASLRSKLTHAAILTWFALGSTSAKPAWFPATLPKSNAKLELEFPYPFEVVLRTWENGPKDPQFLREEVSVSRSGNHIEKSKTIFTKNPFPYLIQKTVMRDPELIFLEVESINMKDKVAQYWSVNKCMEYVGRAYRTSTIRAHPTKKGYTLIEQGGGVEVNTNVPGALRGPIENFACGAFIDVCKQALDKLNVTLHRQSLRTGSPTATEPVEEAASSTTTSGTLHGLGLVLGGLCCKVLLSGSWRGSTLKPDDDRVSKPAAAAAAAASSRPPMLSRQTPPFRAAAAAFAVALVSTQLL